MGLTSEGDGRESPGIVFEKIPGPGKSWKMSLVLETPGILFEKFPGIC